MSLRKDKQKVLGEVFDDERIRSFLSFEAPEGVNPDFHLLEKAYRGMKAENFNTFIKFFQAENRDINASNPEGKTLRQLASGHRLGEEYALLLSDAGAH
jgi:hypothetical protein